jgi:hypothetical protein
VGAPWAAEWNMASTRPRLSPFRTSGASPSGEGQVLREATRPIESADLREVSDLRKRATEPRLWGEKPMLRPILFCREHVRGGSADGSQFGSSCRC